MILLLRKELCVINLLFRWEKLNRKLLLFKQSVFSELDNKETTGNDYRKTQRVSKTFNLNKLGEFKILFVI